HYELKPKDMRELLKAEAVFTLGVEAWEKRLESSLPKGKVIKLKGSINLLRYGQFTDPHIWLSPKQYLTLVSNMKANLSKWDSSKELEERYRDYERKLMGLDQIYEQILKTCKIKTMITTHKAWGYLARDYNLKNIGIMGVHAEEEPKPSYMINIINTMKKDGIKVVFAEVGEDRKVADFIASQTGARVILINSSLFPFSAQDDYFSIMRKNLERIREGLECQK
ncbi:MAG: metal ABC transporter substrate-binding protein, partial [Aquificaceae bacterium]